MSKFYVISVMPFRARQGVFSCHVKRDFLSHVRTTSFPARLISVILCLLPFVSCLCVPSSSFLLDNIRLLSFVFLLILLHFFPPFLFLFLFLLPYAPFFPPSPFSLVPLPPLFALPSPFSSLPLHSPSPYFSTGFPRSIGLTGGH